MKDFLCPMTKLVTLNDGDPMFQISMMPRRIWSGDVFNVLKPYFLRSFI